jgi:Ras homolog enriched in brain
MHSLRLMGIDDVVGTMSKGNDPTIVHRKIAILGFRAVGKSSLTNSFVSGTFSET